MNTQLDHISAGTLTDFVGGVMAQLNPSWIVTAERKGTALLRTYADSLDAPGRQNLWRRVVSSVRISSSTLTTSEGPVLVLDEGAYFGANLSQTLASLEELGVPRSRIKTAVFGVHEACRLREPVDFHWYGSLSAEDYRTVRNSLVNCFQRRGSLLLDTEHIEVSVRLRCGRLELFDALCHLGVGVQHVSKAGRTNLTVSRPAVSADEVLLQQLPLGTTCRDVVSKIRVVERAPDEYAILPIWFPSVPSDATRRGDAWQRPEWATTPAQRDADVFYIAGLQASLHMLRSVGAALSELVENRRVEVRVPRSGEPGDGVSHLTAMFGGIDVERLREAIESSLESGRRAKRSRRKTIPPTRIDAAPHSADGRRLETVKWALAKAVHDGCRLPLVSLRDAATSHTGSSNTETETGGTFAEVHRLITDELRHDQTLLRFIGAALDQLIDQAVVIPAVGRMPFNDGVDRYVRTFRLDGEVVRADVARLVSLWRGRTADCAGDWEERESRVAK